jgi:Homeobox KN domain
MQSSPPNNNQAEEVPLPTPGTERGACTAAAAEAPPRNDSKDDLDLLLLHVDFPLLLTMAAKVKQLRNSGAAAASRDPSTIPTNDDAFEAAKRIQAKILSSSSLPTQSSPPILRGQYPMTDVIMDDALMELQDEIDAYSFNAATAQPISPASNSLVATLLDRPSKRRPESSSDRPERQLPPASIHYDHKKKGDSIAIKYSKWQTDILMGWMIANSESPFPDPCDVTELANATGLTHSQVVNWTTNVRKRNLKATCRGSKKPHHFIDFLFLKQDREGRLGGGRESGGVRYSPPETQSSAVSVPSSIAAGVATRTTAHQPTARYHESHTGSHPRARRIEGPRAEPRTEALDDHQLLNEDEVHELEPLEWKLPDHGAKHGLVHTELLQDFANYWTDDDEDSSYLLDASISLELAAQKRANGFGELSWLSSSPNAKMPPSAPPALRVSETSPGLGTRQRRILLPSVTLDSHEDERFGSHEYWAHRGAVPARLVKSSKGIPPKRYRPPTPPPLDELYLYPTDLEDPDDYEPLLSPNVHHAGRYGEDDDDGDDDDNWIRAWDIEEGRPLKL